MSVVSEINRIKTNIANAYTELKNKNATIPSVENSEGLPSAIASIQTGGGSPITKGLVINEVDNNGYVTDASIVGMTSIPNYYLYNASYVNGSNYSFLAKIGANLHFPSDLQSIGNFAFAGYTTLAITELPDSITSIGNNAFQSCEQLALTKLPNSLASLGNYAFRYSTKLTEITCPSDINSIGTGAFYGCSKLSKIVLPNITKIPTLGGSNVFSSTLIESGRGYIYIPDALVEECKTATNWSSYASQIKGVSEL